mgnify:CR=1 FL=1
MVNTIKEKIEQFHMLEKGDRILIGLSGGSDSICLARVLYELRSDYELELAAVCCHQQRIVLDFFHCIEFCTVCCHHGLRGKEADLDVRFTEKFCKDHGMTFFEKYEDVQRVAKEKGISVEEAGREFRYASFRSIMEAYAYNKLAIAHNGDDRAETMLFHLARGTGIAGLCTMEPMREFFEGRYLIRPLLWTRKREIENWLKEKNIFWRLDESNNEDIYTRNQIRHHILPKLTAVNDRAVEHMGGTAEQLSEVYSYIKEEEQRIYDSVTSKQENGLEISVSLLKKQHSYMQKSILYRCVCELSQGRKDVSSSHVKILLDLMNGETGREAHLLKGIRSYRQYDRLILVREGTETADNPVKKERDILGRLELVIKKYSYTDQEISKNEYTKQFDCAKIQKELCLRFWQEGDYLYLKKDGGKKKLNRYFIDNKIPSDMRKQIPLLADGSHILWIVGHRISAYYKVTEGTKEILEVTIENKG